MKSTQKLEKRAFLPGGEPPAGNTQRVSSTPLFIGSRGKVDELEEKWRTRILCLRHGEHFYWKKRCAYCHYLIGFQVRRFD